METIEKIYFSLKEAAKEIGVSESCLRFRGHKFNIFLNGHNKGHRIRLSRKQIDDLKLVDMLVRQFGMRDWKIKELLRKG